MASARYSWLRIAFPVLLGLSLGLAGCAMDYGYPAYASYGYGVPYSAAPHYYGPQPYNGYYRAPAMGLYYNITPNRHHHHHHHHRHH